MFLQIDLFQPHGIGQKRVYQTQIKEVPDGTNLQTLKWDITHGASNGPFKNPFPPNAIHEWVEIRRWDNIQLRAGAAGTMLVFSLDHPDHPGECDVEILFPLPCVGGPLFLGYHPMQDTFCLHEELAGVIDQIQHEGPRFQPCLAHGPRHVNVYPNLSNLVLSS